MPRCRPVIIYKESSCNKNNPFYNKIEEETLFCYRRRQKPRRFMTVVLHILQHENANLELKRCFLQHLGRSKERKYHQRISNRSENILASPAQLDYRLSLGLNCLNMLVMPLLFYAFFQYQMSKKYRAYRLI